MICWCCGAAEAFPRTWENPKLRTRCSPLCSLQQPLCNLGTVLVSKTRVPARILRYPGGQCSRCWLQHNDNQNTLAIEKEFQNNSWGFVCLILVYAESIREIIISFSKDIAYTIVLLDIKRLMTKVSKKRYFCSVMLFFFLAGVVL